MNTGRYQLQDGVRRNWNECLDYLGQALDATCDKISPDGLTEQDVQSLVLAARDLKLRPLPEINPLVRE